jgi:O-antigen/teichoic acid export membrane protein
MGKIQKIKSFFFKNTSTKQTVAKNTVWLTISNFGGRLIKAIIVIFGARMLGTAEWGIFSYAVTLAGFFTSFMDPGVNAILMREAPKAEEKQKMTLFSTTLVMKITLIILTAIFVLIVAPYFTTLPGAKILLPIVVLIIAFDTLREFFSSFIRTMEKMEWEAGIFLLTNLVIVIAGFIFLLISPTAKAFAWAYVAGTAAGAITATFVLRRYLKNIFSFFDVKIIKPLIYSAWPFAITGALGILLTNTDILIISWMRSASDVGIYSAAIRIVQVFYIIPVVLQLSTLPLFARLANKDNEKFRVGLEKTVGMIFLISIPLAFGGFILGSQIMQLIFGSAYISGSWAFRILMLTLLVDFPATIISTAIFAYNNQKKLIITSLIGGIGNVVFDLLFIPKFGIVGSAIATLLAQILSNWYLWHTMKKINYFNVISKLKKVALSAILMSSVTLLLFSLHINVLINIIISAIVYIGILILFKEQLFKEVAEIIGLNKLDFLTKKLVRK